MPIAVFKADFIFWNLHWPNVAHNPVFSAITDLTNNFTIFLCCEVLKVVLADAVWENVHMFSLRASDAD